jgi:hypothetical protein
MTEDSMSGRLLHIGRDLQSRLKGFFEVPLGPDATPLELLQAALDELERKVQPAGRGKRVFPYDRVVVRIAQRGADPIAVEAVFANLEARLQERLQELKCEAPEKIAASVSLAEPSGDERGPLLKVECFSEPGRRAEPVTRTQQYPSLKITVVKGQCDESEYIFEEPLIAIGRTAEPIDAFGQVRYNHVAFLEVRDGVNETVGRAHARLQFDNDSGHYQLFNDGSSNPTSILRGGKMIRVPPRDPRGVRVQSGDSVQLGRAVLKLMIQ